MLDRLSRVSRMPDPGRIPRETVRQIPWAGALYTDQSVQGHGQCQKRILSKLAGSEARHAPIAASRNSVCFESRQQPRRD